MSRATFMSFDKTDVHYGSWDGIKPRILIGGFSEMRPCQCFEEKTHAYVGQAED